MPFSEHRRVPFEQLADAVLRSTDDAVVAHDLDGNVVGWNPAAERMYGWTADEMSGSDISRIVPQDKQEELQGVFAKLRRGERVRHFVTTRCDRAGRHFPVSLTISPIRTDDGELVGASAIARDIRDQTEVEKELRRAMEQAEAGNRAKDRFLATVSHELRTPLNAILGYATLLSDGITGELTGEQFRQVERIERGVRALMALIEQILDYTRSQAGEAVAVPEDVDLRRVIRETIEEALPAAEARGLELGSEISVTDPTARTDAGILRQILRSLVSNALKFTAEGGVRVELAAGTDDLLELRVRDTGPGIREEDRDLIFRPFIQLESFSTRTAGGTGLGLSVSLELARLIEGRLRVESVKSGGSVFIIEFPRELRGDAE